MHKQIKLLLLINSFSVLAISLFGPLYAVYVQGFDSSIVHIGGVWGFFVFLSGILTYAFSKYENKYPTQFLIASFVFRAVGWAAYIFVDSLMQVYLVQILLALGEAFGIPSFDALFSKYLDKGKFASEWGLHATVNAFMVGIAAFLGALIVDSFGFIVLFIGMIILSGVSTCVALKYRKFLIKRA